MERKLLPVEALQLKMNADEAHNVRKFEGYASVFNGIDAYGDRIEPGAYTRTLKNRKRPIQLRWNHDGPVMGKYTDIFEDEKGLYVKGELTPGHSVADDAYALMMHGAVTGLSIGYTVLDSEVKDNIRLLKDIELFEISVVEEPADNYARVTDVKSAIEACVSWKEIEAILRDEGGFSRTTATKLVQRCKSLAHGERAEKEASETQAKWLEQLAERIAKNG